MPEPFSKEWYELGRLQDERTKEEARKEAQSKSQPIINKMLSELTQIRKALCCKTEMRWGVFGPYYGYPDDIKDILEAIQKLKINSK